MFRTIAKFFRTIGDDLIRFSDDTLKLAQNFVEVIIQTIFEDIFTVIITLGILWVAFSVIKKYIENKSEEPIKKIESNGGYHGNIKSHIFHKPGCVFYDVESGVSSFRTHQEAINAGFRPCKVCDP